VPVRSQRSNCGLQFPTSRDLQPRKVRPRSLCHFENPKQVDCWSCSLTSVLSINAAISASVVLASRLPDDISVFALMLYAVVLFAMFPVLRHRLQVSCAPISPYRVSREDHIDPVAFICLLTEVDILADMLLSSIGRPIILPGVPYDPSICDIAPSHRPLITICRMDLRRGSKLGPVRRPGCPCVGTEVQKVTDPIIREHGADIFPDTASELRGSWDVAVPQLNRRRRGKSVAMMEQSAAG